MRLFTPNRQLLWGLLISTLSLSSCAWIPQGEKPAEFLKTPPLEQALSHTGSEPMVAARHWPPERW